jgi:hypothetical protein
MNYELHGATTGSNLERLQHIFAFIAVSDPHFLSLSPLSL